MSSRGIAVAVVCAVALCPVAMLPSWGAEKDAGVPVPKASIAAPAQPGVPDGFRLNMLIRTTLIALGQANQTGNYSVLRDLGTAQFQASNTDTRLGEIFATLRARNLDFSPVIFFEDSTTCRAAPSSFCDVLEQNWQWRRRSVSPKKIRLR